MNKLQTENGFSIAELVIVLAILTILSTLAIMTISSATKYSSDNQAKRMLDFFDEARQKALNQRRAFRVEVNKTKQQLILISENEPENASDDVIVSRATFSNDVVIGVKPTSVSAGPTTSSPAPVPSFTSSSYPLSNGDEKITLRFKRNGQVTDAGTDNIGTGSVTSGATIYIHSNKPTAARPDIIRAVVLLGTTGDTSVYKCNYTTSTVCGNWKK